MNFLFNPENKFWTFMAKVTDNVLMAFLWLVTSLPIITMGAANTAYYEFSLHQVTNTEGSLWKSYFTSFKRHFKKATILWLIELFGLAFFALDLRAAWILYTTEGGISALVVASVCLCCSFIFLGSCCYVWPNLALFDHPVKKTLVDSFIMAMANLHVTITLFVMMLLVGVGIFYVSGLFFVWIGLYIFFSSYFITGVFFKYTGQTLDDEEA